MKTLLSHDAPRCGVCTTGRAPEGSGVPVGTEYHWYILAHQNVAKQTANDYTTSLTGLKFKTAHKRAGSEKWSATPRTQRKRMIMFLRSVLADLERQADCEDASIAARATPVARRRRKARMPQGNVKGATGRQRRASRVPVQRYARRHWRAPWRTFEIDCGRDDVVLDPPNPNESRDIERDEATRAAVQQFGINCEIVALGIVMLRVLEPGRNCSVVARTNRFALLVDGSSYYGALAESIARARRTVVIVGWDLDSRVRLGPAAGTGRLIPPLRDFLPAVAAANPDLNIYILTWDFSVVFANVRDPKLVLGQNPFKHPRVHLEFDSMHPPGASHVVSSIPWKGTSGPIA